MSEPSTGLGAHVPGGVAEARRALVEWIREAGAAGRTFLQAYVRIERDGGFSVRHVEDRGRAADDLRRHADPFTAREVAQTTEEGAHRPLKTAPNLRRGWCFETLDERGLWTVLDYLYPACVGHWHAGRRGTLRVTHWRDTANRQSGMYSPVKLLGAETVRDAVRACCEDAVCLRRVAWGLDRGNPEPLLTESLEPNALAVDPAAAGPYGGEAEVPCPEACSMFISFARTVLSVERAPRSPVDGLGLLNEMELEQIRELVEAAAEPEHSEVREGEFDLPLNSRRLRYLAVRLESAEEAVPGGAASPAHRGTA